MLLINFFKKASRLLVCKKKNALMLFLYPYRSSFLIVISVLFFVQNFAQSTTHSQINRLEELSKLSQESFAKSDSLARSYAQQMFDLANDNRNEAMQGEALYLIAKSYRQKSAFKALEHYKMATPFLETSSHNWLSELYYEKSNIHTFLSEFPEALSLALKSLEYNQLNNIENNIQRDMSFIGYIHDRMYEYRESIKWNRKALDLAIKLGNKSAQAVCYGRIGIAYDELAENNNFNQKLFDSALYYNLKAAKLSEEAGDLGFARTTYSNIGNSYSKLRRYDKAEEYTLKSLAVPGFEEKKGVTLVNLGKIYLETGRYEAAKKILDSAMKNTIHYGTRKYQFEAYYRMHELDVKKGNYKSALQNYIEYKSIEDSLLNETKTKQIVEVSERYKTAEKEREILVQRAELAEQNVIIQQRNYQLFGLIGLAAILGLVGYLLYNQQKLKNKQLQKESELKEALVKIETQNKLQDQRLRISRDLHDNIGAQLTFIISSLDNLKYGYNITNQGLEDKLSGISSFTRDTIYELRDTIWAMNKSEITFEDLQSRISNFIEKANITSKDAKFEFTIDNNVNVQTTFTSINGMNIYRIIQEAVNNAIKYAEASLISVKIHSKNDVVEIEVNDNGKGFNMATVELGNGIYNMKKRAEEIKAKLIIGSLENKGTQIKLTI
jgi:signal transduction histidine kinase